MATPSEEPVLASAGKNFRSSYYKSLGFRGEEKNISQLEGLIKADPIGIGTIFERWKSLIFCACVVLSS